MKRWTLREEKEKYSELQHLYVEKNKTIKEVGVILGIAEQTVFQRIRRLGILSIPHLKPTSIAKRRTDIIIPKGYSPQLAEFFGIMLGDGSLSHYQVVVTLGSKEERYVEYVVNLIHDLFGALPKVGIRKTGFSDVYLGSLELTDWLRKEGLTHNKVLAQIDAPKWLFGKKEFLERFLRGFFDTDGSIYKLRYGIQISLTNKSKPLLGSLRRALLILSYHPSRINDNWHIYLTRREDVARFFREIIPANLKHTERFEKFIS